MLSATPFRVSPVPFAKFKAKLSLYRTWMCNYGSNWMSLNHFNKTHFGRNLLPFGFPSLSLTPKSPLLRGLQAVRDHEMPNNNQGDLHIRLWVIMIAHGELTHRCPLAGCQCESDPRGMPGSARWCLPWASAERTYEGNDSGALAPLKKIGT